MWLCGTCGDTLSTIGIIMAIKNKKVAGFKPATWFQLAMVFYMYFIMSILSRILAEVSKQEKG